MGLGGLTVVVGGLVCLARGRSAGRRRPTTGRMSKSTQQLVKVQGSMGREISHLVVGLLLKQMSYSLQATADVVEGAEHPDRAHTVPKYGGG